MHIEQSVRILSLLICMHCNRRLLSASNSGVSWRIRGRKMLFLLLSLLSWAVSRAEFSLGIRDSIMVAHSFRGEEFGPAQSMHGATYTVDADFVSAGLAEGSNWVIDIGFASQALAEVLTKYNFKNLDELFPGENTTTEFMCRAIHRDLAAVVRNKPFRGDLRVKLFESHKAWASFTAPVQ